MKIRAWLLLILLLPIGSADAEIFQYIYIEANEGNSSGGHTAIQFGNEMFHYQHADGLIRLFKQPAEEFRFNYRFLQNRTLHIADVAVSGQTYRRLYEHFKLRFFEQEQKFRRLQALQQDRLLTEWLLRRLSALNPVVLGDPDASLQVHGAGLFFNDSDFAPGNKPGGECQTATAATKILSLLHSNLQHRYGVEFLPRRAAELTSSIGKLAPQAASSGSDTYSFAQRYNDLLGGLLALRVLQETRPLAADACFKLAQEELNAQEISALQALQQSQLQSAQALLTSTRPDWGYALLVTMARLVAIEQSLQNRRWVFVDDFGARSATISAEEFTAFRNQMRAQRNDAAADWHEQRERLKSGAMLEEQRYSRLEMAANRHHEWLQDVKRKPLRYLGEQPLPVKSIRLPELAFPQLSPSQLREALRSQEQEIQRLDAQLQQQYAYNLFNRNCVTEIFRVIAEAIPQQAEQQLGGSICATLNFIPFASFVTVNGTYNVVKTEELPSYRKQRLAQQYAAESDPWVYAREANIFSATLYAHHPGDTWFVFFTDDALLLRPLFGAVNTAAAVGQSLSGLLRWPFDDGKQMLSGMRGLLMSLPELAFINMRKGSYRYLSPRSITANMPES